MALGTSVGKDVLELRECDYMVLGGAESPCKCIKGIDSIIGSNKNQLPCSTDRHSLSGVLRSVVIVPRTEEYAFFSSSSPFALMHRSLS